ncbi:MAG: DUF1631 domain-containing protein [Betaproteobacteria bacterium]|nr:DUF1631 domain-containing protein [Betaproteobacteria bacterium]
MEHDLCDLVEELGPTLAEETRTLAANTTRDLARRNACLRLYSALQNDWSKLTPAFRDALARRAKPVNPGDRRRQEAEDAENLQILSDDELAAQIAMREVIERVDAACSEETNALDRRISLLVLRSVLPHGYNPFSVDSVCSCLESACGAIFPETDQRALLVQLIGEHLASELPQLYRAINETLIDADILPRLKRSYNDAAPASAGVAAAEAARMMSTLERLAKARTPTGGKAVAPGNAVGGREFLDSLSTLQKAPAAASAATGAPTNVVRLARDSAAARNVAPVEAVALDIVSALFDLIFNDENVSDGIKALVSRLQMPVLKVAMLNQEFFADRRHPARRFLNSISGIAIRWGKFVDANDPFYRKLSELVERIQTTYDTDTGVFDAAITELGKFIDERDAIEAEASRALAEAVRAREEEIKAQREAQAVAQQQADQALAPLLPPEVPREIELFLLGYWRDVLQSRIFSSGTDGAPLLEALQVASDLILSVVPKKEAEDQRRLANALPALVKSLNAGLDEIGISAEERRGFMDTLVELCLAALRRETRVQRKAETKVDAKVDTKPAAIGPGPTLQVSHATESGVRVQDISLPGGGNRGAENTPAAASLRRVRQLVRGDWVDFMTGGQVRRERLTWINPIRTLILFSNHAAECAISITPEALALRLQNHTVRLVKRDTPMFERALHGAVKSIDTLG